MIARHKPVLAVAIIAALTIGGVAWLLRDPEPYFLSRRSSLARITLGASVVEQGFALTPVRLTATSGLAVDLVVRRATADSGPLPVVIVLGGHHTGRDAARMIGDTHGVVVAALSYPFAGDPRPDAATFVRELPQIRTAFLDTPPAILLALDYVLRLPGVDSTRAEVAGVSLGAPFACIAGALDPRFSRVWAVHGSGGSYVPLEANMHRTIPFAPVRVIAAVVANLIIDGPRLDPVRWVARISPRPFVMVNAVGDERLPHGAIAALYAAARQPREQIWMPGHHIHADSATIQRIVAIVIVRVRESPSRPRGSAVTLTRGR